MICNVITMRSAVNIVNKCYFIISILYGQKYGLWYTVMFTFISFCSFRETDKTICYWIHVKKYGNHFGFSTNPKTVVCRGIIQGTFQTSFYSTGSLVSEKMKKV
jgi:hypothetical protein